MHKLLRAAAVSVASTALVAGGATVATGAPAPATSSTVAATAATARPEAATYSRFWVDKRGSKVTFKVRARYRDSAGTLVSIRKVKLQVAKGGKWRTFKNLKLNSKGKGTYKRSANKKRTYRVLIPSTAAYRGAYSKIRV